MFKEQLQRASQYLILLLLAARAHSADLEPLFLEDSSTSLKPAAQEKLSERFGPTLLHGRTVTVNPAIFKHGQPGDRIVLNLFPGLSYEAVCTGSSLTRPVPAGLRNWIGRVVGQEETSDVSINLSDDNVANGYVILDEREYNIVPTDANGTTNVVELAPLRKRDANSLRDRDTKSTQQDVKPTEQ